MQLLQYFHQYREIHVGKTNRLLRDSDYNYQNLRVKLCVQGSWANFLQDLLYLQGNTFQEDIQLLCFQWWNQNNIQHLKYSLQQMQIQQHHLQMYVQDILRTYFVLLYQQQDYMYLQDILFLDELMQLVLFLGCRYNNALRDIPHNYYQFH